MRLIGVEGHRSAGCGSAVADLVGYKTASVVYKRIMALFQKKHHKRFFAVEKG